MYIKLNWTAAVGWKDIFNTLRIILSNNINNVNDLLYGIQITGVTGLQGSNQITLPTLNSTQLAQLIPATQSTPGSSVSGTGIGIGATITSTGPITSGSTITLSVNNTSAITGSVTFGGGTSSTGTDFKNSNYIDAGISGSLDATNSEIYRTVSPGTGYGTSGVSWTYNWQSTVNGSPIVGSTTNATPSYNGFNGPEIVFQRTVSSYSPTSGSDVSGKYYIRLRYDSTNTTDAVNGPGFYVGTYATGTGLGSASITGNYVPSPTLSNGEDRQQGYNIGSVTSFFLYMTPTSFLVGGKGPTTSPVSTPQGWITSVTRRVTNYGWTTNSSVQGNLINSYQYWGDGTKIRFDTATNANPGQLNITTGTPYYVRQLNSVTNFSIGAYLFNAHTGGTVPTAGANPYITASVTSGTNDILIDSLPPHNVTVSNTTNAHFGPAFVSEFTPYDPQALTSNGYIPVMYSGGYYQHNGTGAGGLAKSWYGVSAQDFLWADPYHVSQAYKVLSIKSSTPNLSNNWPTIPKAPVYIGTDQRTIERAPLGDSYTDTANRYGRPLTPALSDLPGYKFPDANLNPSYGLFPLVWSASQYATAGGKLSTTLAGFMLFNGDYQPDDYFDYSGTRYSLWPLADGHLRRLGLAVPKT
jgi:hypothetical protein